MQKSPKPKTPYILEKPQQVYFLHFAEQPPAEVVQVLQGSQFWGINGTTRVSYYFSVNPNYDETEVIDWLRAELDAAFGVKTEREA